jgi:hypothetical protein
VGIGQAGMEMAPEDGDDVGSIRQERELTRLKARIKALEEALADYALRYGLTDFARLALQDTADPPEPPAGEERKSPKCLCDG